MLVTILITIYCTLAYVAGFKWFEIKVGNTSFAKLLLWLLSPISAPVFVLLGLAMAIS